MLILVACDTPTSSPGQITSPLSDLQHPVMSKLPRRIKPRGRWNLPVGLLSKTGSHGCLALLLVMNKDGNDDVEEDADQIVPGGIQLLISTLGDDKAKVSKNLPYVCR
ncbi:unnamed protein product [Lota lota]